MLPNDPACGGDGRFRSFSSLVRLDVSGGSHPGLGRPISGDQFFIARLTRSIETLVASLQAEDVPERADEVNYIMMVADGMDGDAAGKEASRMAISELINLALLLPDWIFRMDEEHRPELEWRARRLIRQVDAILEDRGAQDAALRGMATTLTAVRSLGRDLMIVHVGDSRAYLYRRDRLRRLTRDHTYAQGLADAGQLMPGDVAAELRQLLTNVVGGSHDHVAVDIDMLQLEDGDRVLLCSDGLTDVLDDETIAKALAGASASSEACHRLIQLALAGGGHDHITVVVAAYAFPSPPSSGSAAAT